MSIVHVRVCPSHFAGVIHRVVAPLLTLVLACTVTCLAVSPAAAAGAPTTASLASVAVDDMTYASGAGKRTWGLRSHAAWSARVGKHTFPAVTIGGYRASSGDHGERLAADFMVHKKAAKGDRIARFARKHHRQLNVTYVIWYQRIWSVERAREGWRRMADQGSVTANHKDHVHVSFRREPNDDTYRR